MSRRSKRSQSEHDAEVARIARSYERKGFNVSADVKGFRQPETIGGYRPDVVAKKGRDRRIVEVETRDSVDSARDEAQQSAFGRAADKTEHTTFRRVVVKK